MSLSRSALFLAIALTFAAPQANALDLAAHKALYDIKLTATHSGSQILNISGRMSYEWKPSCDAWVTDHHFQLKYEYADAPPMVIGSDFSTYESFDGKTFNYSSRRKKDGTMYQEIRGNADMNAASGKAVFSLPDQTSFDLAKGTLFPMGHTLELIKRASAGEKFYTASVFDGSDENGPVEISSFIGRTGGAPAALAKNDKVDASLLQDKAWNIRMAVFPADDQEEESDYEMGMVFHENGIISDMSIEYDDFTVSQKLVALEKIPAESCGAELSVPKKP